MAPTKFFVLDQDMIINGVPIASSEVEFDIFENKSVVLCVLFRNMCGHEIGIILEEKNMLYYFQTAARLFLFSGISYFVLPKQEVKEYKKSVSRYPVLFLTRMKTLQEISEEGEENGSHR